ncbi:APC family permease [Shimia sp. Alg240-R146]|uniref:APC family permease n=1 Tax=Shimia sp. Alg240-R146 TaxID=2993449 RepID=UPI0022DFA742|nr:amino acid permease [Shimia sp. Alg240-R146]
MSEHLKRSVGLGLLTAYGVGVMVGAGIYVLVGAVAGEAGIYAPLAFLLAGLVAAPTALSYGELSARIPEAAGEAAFVEKAFGSQALAVLVGLAIVATGVVSAAAVLRGGAGYLLTLVSLPQVVAIVGLAIVLIGVALYGVMESLALAAVFTVIELAGLALVVWAGSQASVTTDWAMAESTPFVDLPWGAIGAAAVLAFFAFIGFEDIVNMAEETQRPERNVPWAIILSLGITTVVYALVTWVTVRVVPIADLAESERPLVLVLQSRGGANSGTVLAAIAVFAALNGVLAQIVMASRVLFGLGRRTQLLAMFYHVHPQRGTPYVATLLVGGLVILAAMSANVSALAEITSIILLTAFVVMNAALILLKLRSPEAPFRVHMAVPVTGMALALGALGLYLGVFG